MIIGRGRVIRYSWVEGAWYVEVSLAKKSPSPGVRYAPR